MIWIYDKYMIVSPAPFWSRTPVLVVVAGISSFHPLLHHAGRHLIRLEAELFTVTIVFVCTFENTQGTHLAGNVAVTRDVANVSIFII